MEIIGSLIALMMKIKVEISITFRIVNDQEQLKGNL